MTKNEYTTDGAEDAVSKGPWSNGGKELKYMTPEGMPSSCWVMSVLDVNGHMVCHGSTADMEFIAEMENACDAIVRMLKEGTPSAERLLAALEPPLSRRRGMGDLSGNKEKKKNDGNKG